MGGALLLPFPARAQPPAVGAGTVGTVSLWVGRSVLVDSAPGTVAAVTWRKLQSQSQERSPARDAGRQAQSVRPSVHLSPSKARAQRAQPFLAGYHQRTDHSLCAVPEVNSGPWWESTT